MSDWAKPGAEAILAGGTMPTTFYVQMHTANPSNLGTSNIATDTRRIGGLTMDVRDPVVDGSVTNTNYAEILSATTTENITHVSFWDSSTSGVCYFVDALAATLEIEAGQTVAVAGGQATITLTQWV